MVDGQRAEWCQNVRSWGSSQWSMRGWALLESDDEAKAPTRQITGHKDLLSSSEPDESVTTAIEIRQVQQAEFRGNSLSQVFETSRSPSRRSSRGVTSVRSNVGASWWSRRGDHSDLLVCARWCTFLETPTKRRKLWVAGHHDEVQWGELRGQVNLVWNTDPIETVELVNLMVRLHRVCTVAKCATNLEEPTVTNMTMCSGYSTRFRDKFKQSLGWRLFHVVVLLIRRWSTVIRISEWWQHWYSQPAGGTRCQLISSTDGISLASPAEAMEASVAARGVERWTVVRSSEDPEHVAHHEWEREVCIVLAWSESVHGFDSGRVWEYVPWIQTPEREQVGYHIGTIPLRWWHSGSSKWLGLVWEQCRSDNTYEEPGPVRFLLGLQYDWCTGSSPRSDGWTQTMFEQQILNCNIWGWGCQGGTQRQLSLQCSCDMTSMKDGGAMLSRRSWRVDVSSRDRPTLTCNLLLTPYNQKKNKQNNTHKKEKRLNNICSSRNKTIQMTTFFHNKKTKQKKQKPCRNKSCYILSFWRARRPQHHWILIFKNTKLKSFGLDWRVKTQIKKT